MTNNNPGGTNQFGNYTIQPGYGDVKRQTELLRESPMSGSPLAAQALNAPRRAQRQTRTAPVSAPAPVPPPVGPGPAVHSPATYQAIAQIPGITPVWGELLG